MFDKCFLSKIKRQRKGNCKRLQLEQWLYSLQPKVEKLYTVSKKKTGSWLWLRSVQFSSVAQSCPTLCDPMNRSTPGLPVHHQLLEFTQTHVHQVSDVIQPSHPLSPSPPAPNASQHQSLFQWVNSSHEVAKVAQIMNSLLQKLKKVGKTTRPFRYELNQIPCDYTVKVTNRFKGLDLIECLKNYGWRFVTLYMRQ